MSDTLQDDVILAVDVSFGEKLKARRESMCLSMQEAASRLHLSPRFIVMLENENLLQCALPLIYLRGYLRSYTRLLNLPEQELAPLLEKLDPKPILETPLPATPDAGAFSLEAKPYYAHIVTIIISFMLLTSVTAWWYLHANKPTQTIIALKEPLIFPEPSNPLSNSGSPTPTLETAAKTPETQPAKLPETPVIDPNAKKPVTVAAATPTPNLASISAKRLEKPLENDDDGADE